jgi:acyl-CoA synthetase (AMP-forming)/AMP-acid ligase II
MIVRSPYPDTSIPEMAFDRFVLHKAAALGDKPALVDVGTGYTLSYSQLARRVRQFASGLSKRGLRKGDVMAIFSPNHPDYAVAILGVAAAGGASATINPLYTADEVTAQLQDAGAKFLLTIPPLLDRAKEAAARSGVKEVFVIGSAPGVVSLDDLLDREPSQPGYECDARKDLVAIPFSSGTTGRSKGVMLTHFSVTANVRQCLAAEMIVESDRVLATLPFFHIYGMVLILGLGLYQGATLYTMPRFDLEVFLRAIQDRKITYAPCVPPIVLALAKHPLVNQFDLSSLRLIACGAAPVAASTLLACADRLKCNLVQGYGMTEASGATHLNGRIRDPEKTTSIGPPVPNCEAKIVDIVSGAALGPKEQGEICVRGPNIMLGYLNLPDATAQSIDAEGWYHTGDIGYADDDGYFFVVDRLKELIKYSGYQVAPAELEAVLVSHPAIAEAAVIPSPDEEHGEIPKAFVVRKGELSEQQVMDYVAARVAPFKKVRLVEFIDQIPKSPTGKILRRELLERERLRIGAAIGGTGSGVPRSAFKA